ncbi:MAG: hypothetical protein ACPGJE_04585 [Wenzhouxiangellaceae bacterium]
MSIPNSNPSDVHAMLHELTDRSLSPVARYGHVVLLLAAAGMAALILALLLTEPALPARTQLAFGALLLIAGGWIAYAGWVLSNRRPMFQRHRVVAGWMAIAFSGGFALISALAGMFTGATAAWAASAFGSLMLAVAVLLLRRARKRAFELEARRAALLRAMGEAD